MNSLCSISGHGFRGKTKIILPPTNITSVLVPTITSTSAVFTWSGGLSQDGSTVTKTYTLNGSDATPSSSGTGTATFTLSINTAYTFAVTASTAGGSKTGYKYGVNTGGSPTLLYNFPFLNDVLDYHTGSGVSVGTLTNGNIYWQSTGGYNSGGCLNCSTFISSHFLFPSTPLMFFQSLGFSVSFWFKGFTGSGDPIFSVGNGWNRYVLSYNSGNNCMWYDDGTVSGDIGSNNFYPNIWYHCCWVVPPNTAANIFYINGGSVNGGTTVTMATGTAHTVNCNAAGAFFDNQGVNQSKGFMNNLNIFNYAITQAQITALWQA